MSAFKSPFRGRDYDFVFLGAGCASLSLLMRMLRSGRFKDKKILLLDKEPKTKNDRTWCFWEKEKGFFEEIVYSEWDSISFLSEDYSSSLPIAPYWYKMIRGIDFYEYCFKEIEQHHYVEIVYGEIDGWKWKENEFFISLNSDEHQLGNPVVFNSVYKPGTSGSEVVRLLQHFKGWVIETNTPSFNPGEATMMDFRVHQQHGTTFAYVLPFTTTRALVEYTLFTRNLLPPAQYDLELKNYIRDFLQLTDYSVREEEFGVIPMTNEKFSFYKDGVYHIGTAGGQTKGSSGYTFRFIQKQSDRILNCLLAGRSLQRLAGTPKRFLFYDNTLLDILYHDKLPGHKIFSTLFKKNKPQQVLRFLDNESSLKEELKIISSLPVWPFLKAAFRQF